MESSIDKHPPSSKAPVRLISISVILLIAYAVALFVGLMLSINWLVWVLVAVGMGIGIPILLLLFVSFAGWMYRIARANGLNDLETAELGMTATEGCLVVFFAILELFSHW